MKPEDFYVIIFIVILLLLVILKFNAKKIKSSIKGKLGEKRVALKLRNIPNSVLINDLTFSVNDNKTCQIDHVLVCSRGIFVIETKTYSGRIYGDDSKREWTQVLQYGKVKNIFYSPVKQNNTHIYELSKRINNHNIFNCVVFVKNNISFIESEYVYSLRNIKKFIMKQPEIYAYNDVELIANSIKNLHQDISNKEHVKNIKKMQENIEHNICPRCGSELVLRQGNNGSFYGCSNYPKCKFTKKI